jgi:hypothetical protein
VHRVNNFPGEKLCPGHFCFAQWRKTQSFFSESVFFNLEEKLEFHVVKGPHPVQSQSLTYLTGVDSDVSLPGDSPDASCFGVREGKLFSV